MNRVVLSWTFIGVSTGIVALGCGTDTNGGRSSDNQTSSGASPQSDPITEIAQMVCDTIFSCCDATEQGQASKYLGLEPAPKTTAECVGSYKEHLVGLKESIAAGRLEYDANQASACFAKLNGRCDLYPTTLFFPGLLFLEDPACEMVLGGKVADGGDCYVDIECAQAGSACFNAAEPNFGKCAPLRKENEPCSPNSDCATGLVCSFANICIKPLADGVACEFDSECVSEYCDRNGSGVCEAKKAIGEVCTSTACIDGWCHPDTNVCTAKKADGEPCTYAAECIGRCDNSGGGTQKCLPPMCDGP